MAAAKKSYIRATGRHRKALKVKPVAVEPGSGKSKVIAAKNEALAEQLKRKKTSNKLVRDFDGLGVADLVKKLDESRLELFELRFKHSSGLLESASTLPATRRRIARILTLIKQKEVGA